MTAPLFCRLTAITEKGILCQRAVTVIRALPRPWRWLVPFPRPRRLPPPSWPPPGVPSSTAAVLLAAFGTKAVVCVCCWIWTGLGDQPNASWPCTESRGTDNLTNYLEPMGCCGSSAVDVEERLDYSAGKVTIIPDLMCWQRKVEEASELGQTVVVKFSATWCRPCRISAPVFAELSLKHSDLVFVSIDVDELPELVMQFDIRATPTFIFMRDKKEIDKLVGGNQEDLEKKFDPYCQQK